MNNTNILLIVLCIFILVWSYNSDNREFMGNMGFGIPSSPPPSSPPPSSGPAPGGSGSSPSQQTIQLMYDTTSINGYDAKKINYDIILSLTKIIVNNAYECSASVTQLQTIDIPGMDVGGDFEIGEVDRPKNITFDCVQLSKFINDIVNAIFKQCMDFIKNNFTTSVLDKLESIYTDAIVNIEYKWVNTTDQYKNLQNVVKNIITNNFSRGDVQSCISKVAAAQKFILANTGVRGSIRIGAIREAQASSILVECLSIKNIANKIINSLFSRFEINVDNNDAVKKIDPSVCKDIIPASESSCATFKSSVCKDIIPASESSCTTFKSSVCKDIIPASESSCMVYKPTVCKDIIPASESSCMVYKPTVCKDIIPANVNTCAKYESQICKIPTFGLIFDKSGYFIGPIAILLIVVFFIMSLYGLFKKCGCPKSHEDSE